MKNLVRTLFCVVLLTGVASAAQIQGILMDKMCSAKTATGGQKAAAEHDRDCAVANACQRSGYGVYTADNKWLNFDADGNKQAIAALKTSTKKDDLKVTVEGDVQGDTIKVASLKLQ
jgi:hypothetical protein